MNKKKKKKKKIITKSIRPCEENSYLDDQKQVRKNLGLTKEAKIIMESTI